MNDMVAIPENEVTEQDLIQWSQLNDQLKKIKAAEILLRNKIFKGRFPAPVEGTNSSPLANGYVLKGKYTINREVDLAGLAAIRDKLVEANIREGELVQYKPSLILSGYRTLTAEQQQIVDQFLIIKPGSPALEIVLPAKNRPKEVV